MQDQPSKFKTRKCVKLNNKSDRTYNVDHQIKFKTSILKSRLCDYSDVGSRKKSPPEKSPPDPKPNPIPNLTLTLALTLHGGLFSGEIFS